MDYNRPRNKRPMRLLYVNRARLKSKINNLDVNDTIYVVYEERYYYLTKSRELLDIDFNKVAYWNLFNRSISF